MELSEIREHYFFQLEQKNNIHSAIQFPVSLVVVYVGILIVYSKHLQLKLGLLEILFALSVISVAFACFFIIKVLTFYKYEEIADIRDFLKHKKDLENFFENKSADEMNKANGAFEEDLASRYAQAIDINSEMNRKRYAAIYWANRSLIVAGILIALTLYPYLNKNINERDTTLRGENNSTVRSEVVF